MNPEIKRPIAFTFENSPDFSLFKVGALCTSIFGAVASAREAYTSNQPMLLILTALSLGIMWLVSRSIFKSMPSRMEIGPDSVTLYDVPGMTIQLYQAFVPLLCREKLVADRRALTLEWVGSSLTWNDMDSGRNIFLVAKNGAPVLIDWLNKNGLQVPPAPAD